MLGRRILRSDSGAVECWAWDEDDTVPSPAPADRFTQVSATSGYACGVRTDSTLACWGTNERWPAAPPAGTFSQVSVGSYRACAVGSDARLECWTWTAGGLDELAEAGIRAPADPPAGAYMGVSVAGGYACGLMADGSAVCWGTGQYRPGQRARRLLRPDLRRPRLRLRRQDRRLPTVLGLKSETARIPARLPTPTSQSRHRDGALGLTQYSS